MIPMDIDMTAALMPIVWGMDALLVASAAALAGVVVLPRTRRWVRWLRRPITVAGRPALSAGASR